MLARSLTWVVSAHFARKNPSAGVVTGELLRGVLVGHVREGRLGSGC